MIYLFILATIAVSVGDVYVFTRIADVPSPEQMFLFVSLLLVPYLVAMAGFALKQIRFAAAVTRGMAIMATLLCCLAIFIPLFLFMIPFVIVPIAANVFLFRYCGRYMDEDVEWSAWIVFPAVWLLTIVIAHSVL